MWDKIKAITPATWARTIIMFIALVNQILTTFGRCPLPIKDEDVQIAVSTIFTIIMTLITWWKDHDFTEKARLRKQFGIKVVLKHAEN